MTSVLLYVRKPVDVPRIEHQRLFADGLGAGSQREANMRIMQIIRRTDTDIVHVLTLSAAEVDVAVKSFEFGKEARLGKIAVDNTDRVGRINCSAQIATAVPDRAQMTRRNEAGQTN